jgi:hypothetical protein
MSLYEDILTKIDNVLMQMDEENSAFISPSSVAIAVHSIFKKPNEDARVSYAAIEHFKHMARKRLSRKFDPTSQEAMEVQDDMFSGVLQKRYPIPRAENEEPQYKIRQLLTDEESLYIVTILRKKANSLNAHADHFEMDWKERQQKRNAA